MALTPLLRKEGLIEGRVLRRYKRFLADVELADGTCITAHCTNTGSMATCWESGDRVLLDHAPAPHRKLDYTWLACERSTGWVGVDTGMPNRVMEAAARQNAIPGLDALSEIRREVRYGREGSRIDLLGQDGSGRMVYLEVKNVTQRQGDFALFPDAVSTRGTKHLRELQEMVKEGHRAVLAFFIQRMDVTRFDGAREVDPDYAAELDRAAAAGVEVLPIQVHLDAKPQADGRWILAWSLPGLLPWIPR